MRKVKSSIHIQKGNVYFILHSVRGNDSYSVVFKDEKNEYLYNKEIALKLFRNELKKRELAYNKRTKKKLPKNTAILLSAIVNLYPTHTLQDVKKIADYLEKSLNTKVVSVAIHRDEGKLVKKDTGEEFFSGVDFILNPLDNKLYWVDENKKLLDPVNLDDFEIVKNYHCHIEFLGLDSNGVAIKRNKLNKYYLSKLQTFVAYTLKMERGFNYYKTKTKAPKRLDVKNFKKSGVTKRKAKKEELVKVKDLKEENKRIREEFKELGAKREDYARLEALNRELKEKIKNKELTMQEMQEAFNQELEKLQELAYSKKHFYQNKKPVENLKVANYFEQKSKDLEKKVKEGEEEKEKLKEKIKKLEEELDFFKQKFEYTESYTKARKKQNYFNFNLGYFYYLREMQLNATAYFQYEYKDAKEVKPNEISKVRKVKIETENSTLIDTGDAIQLKVILNKKNKFEEYKKQIKLMIELMIKKGYKLNELEAEGEELFIKAFEEVRNTYFQMNFKKN